MAVSSFVAGIFTDIDHTFDYYKEKGLNLDIKDFVDTLVNLKVKKVYVFLHSYELLPVFVFLVYLSGFNEVAFGALIGYLHHIAFDQIFNPIQPKSLFFWYRCKNNFKREKIFRLDALMKAQTFRAD